MEERELPDAPLVVVPVAGPGGEVGTRLELSGTAELEMQPGDTFVIETPGGGGYGVAESPPPTEAVTR